MPTRSKASRSVIGVTLGSHLPTGWYRKGWPQGSEQLNCPTPLTNIIGQLNPTQRQ